VATDKRQLVLDLLARNKMGPATKAAADDIDKVGDSADKAGKKTEEFGKASFIAGKEADKFGKASEQAQRHVDHLDDEIKKVNQDLVFLAASFAQASTAAERLDISKGIRKSENELRRLTKSKGILESILPEPEPAARSFMKKLGGALGAAGSSLATAAGSKPGIVIGGAIGAAAAPVLISSLGSAISAGVGAAGLGAGIALAVSKDPEIQQAGANMGKKFISGLQDSALKNFGGPIRQSLGVLGDAADRVAKKWDGAFRSLSGSVVPLTRDLVSGVERINDAVTSVASKSGPALEGFGKSWLLLSDAAGDALETLADGSSEAAGNLTLVVGVLGDVIRQSANFLGVLNQLSGNAWLTGPLLPLLKKKYGDAADASNTLKGSTQELAGSMTNAELAARGNADAIAALNTELKKQADPVFALRESQIKLAEAQKASADATKKHGRNSKEAREATRNLAKAALDLQGNVGKLGKDFDGKLTPAMRNTLQAAGLTKGQINAVEREFGQARKAGNAYAKKYEAAVRQNGAASVRKSLYSVKEVAASIPRTVTIAMRITGTKNVSAAAAAVRKNVNTRAGGGPIDKGKPYWVGEEGPELVVPDAAGRVLTASVSRRVAAGAIPGRASGAMAYAGGGGQAARVVFDVTGAETKFKAFMREWIRTGGI
jgi:hypothetical protein